MKKAYYQTTFFYAVLSLRKARKLIFAVAAIFLLAGCVAAAVPMLYGGLALGGYSGFKLIQTSTGGSIEVAVDVSKVTNEQKANIKNIKSIAVWPEKDGSSVSFAEALSKSRTFKVVSPARVATALQQMGLSDDLKLMTSAEANDVFAKVCKKTNSDAVVFSKSIAASANTNMWSLERGNVTTQFITYIYSKNTNTNIVEIPVTIKVLLGGKIAASNDEINNLANAELAKNLLALSEGLDSEKQNPLAQKVLPPSAQSPVTAPTQTTQVPVAVIPPAIDHKTIITEKPTVKYLVTTKSGCSIRLEPNVKGKVIATLEKGQKVEKFDQFKNWYNITLPSGKKGWIHESLVKDAD
jgi:uncharacterized protein YgiM (DUF1202 family)